jgi:hypothetical protein
MYLVSFSLPRNADGARLGKSPEGKRLLFTFLVDGPDRFIGCGLEILEQNVPEKSSKDGTTGSSYAFGWAGARVRSSRVEDSSVG